jgi:hypothetical protein
MFRSLLAAYLFHPAFRQSFLPATRAFGKDIFTVCGALERAHSIENEGITSDVIENTGPQLAIFRISHDVNEIK